MLARLFAPPLEVHAHCDLPCGVYDPAQARIEAESIKGIIAKMAGNDDADFRTRAVLIKEERMPDGQTKLILKEKAGGRVVERLRP